MANLSGTASSTSNTNWISIHGPFTLSLAGIANASTSVQLQRRFGANDTATRIVETYTANSEKNGDEETPGVQYRLAITIGGSDVVNYRLSDRL